MKFAVGFAATLLVITPAFAQVPTGAPAGTTGLCKDGSYWTGANKKGACRGHKGVQNWYAQAEPAAAAPVTAPKPKVMVPSPAAQPKPAVATAGGGPGQVWVNTASKVYHCPGDRYYGKTKAGSYMTEPAAVAAGDRPDHGKACH
jgi:hypothetical protein